MKKFPSVPSILAAAMIAAHPPVVAGPRMSVGGEYMLVLNEGSVRETRTPWFDNLITDIGLDRLATGSACDTFGSIGTGTTAPANGNTTLQAYVAGVSGPVVDSNSNAGSPTYIAQTQMHWVYPQGAVVGNMAEVGVGWSAGGTNLFSRALILDGGGSPTTLTVTSLDQLTVYYKVTITPALTDLTGTVALGGQTYNYTGRVATANSWNVNFGGVLGGTAGIWPKGNGSGGVGMQSYATQTLGAVNLAPTGTASNGSINGTITVGSYSAGQKYLDSTFTALPTECNSAGGVGAIVFFWCASQMQYQYSFSNTVGGTVIPKDNTKTMAFTIRLSWDRV